MGKLPGSNSDRKKWLKRTSCCCNSCCCVIACYGVQKWTSKKEDADLPKVNQSNVEVLPMQGYHLNSG